MKYSARNLSSIKSIPNLKQVKKAKQSWLYDYYVLCTFSDNLTKGELR